MNEVWRWSYDSRDPSQTRKVFFFTPKELKLEKNKIKKTFDCPDKSPQQSLPFSSFSLARLCVNIHSRMIPDFFFFDPECWKFNFRCDSLPLAFILFLPFFGEVEEGLNGEGKLILRFCFFSMMRRVCSGNHFLVCRQVWVIAVISNFFFFVYDSGFDV